MLGLELKRLASGSLVYGIGGILQRFLGLLLLPFFTRVLAPGDYGILALVALVSVGVNGLFTLGTGNSMGVLYYREENLEKRPTIIWSNAALLLANSLMLLAILTVLAPWISKAVFQTPEHAGLFRIAFLSAALVTVTDPFYAYLRMEEKARKYVSLTLVGTALTILMTMIFVLILRRGVTGLLLATLISQVLMLGAVLFTVAQKLPFSVDRRLFAPLVRIGFPSIFGLFAFLVLDLANRQIIQHHLGLDWLGIYSIGAGIGMGMTVFVGAFSTAWPPFFMSFINRRDDARVVFARVLKYYLVGFGLLAVLFFAAAKPMVMLMVAPSFAAASTVVGMIAAAQMLKGCYLIFLPGIYFAEKLHWQAGIEWIAALVNIALNLWWIPLFGITGAAGATLVSYATLPLLAWFVARGQLAVDYDWPKIGLAAAGITASGIWLHKVASHDSLRVVLSLSALSVAMLSLFFAFVVFGSTERRLALEQMKLFLGQKK